jgi:hypothetical protein
LAKYMACLSRSALRVLEGERDSITNSGHWVKTRR